MNSALQAICARHTNCKCCGAMAFPWGVVDFSKCCEVYRRTNLSISGVPIYYYRCSRCRFIFTTGLDHFTHDEFRQHVYNQEYLLIDPDYELARPRDNAAKVCGLFPDAKLQSVLDYGCGHGVLAQLLRAAGFPRVDTYDPFVPEYSTKPLERYECVVCFEVVEHSTDPAGIFADMNELLTDNGMILFSTLFSPPISTGKA